MNFGIFEIGLDIGPWLYEALFFVDKFNYEG